MDIYRIWIDKFNATNLIAREFEYGDGLKESKIMISKPVWRDKLGCLRSLFNAWTKGFIPGLIRKSAATQGSQD